MSSSAAVNTFRNGDTSIENFTSMQQTIIQVLRDKDNFDLYNFEYGNTAVPGIVSGSIVGVNYVLYPFNSTELALYLAPDGTEADASSAPDGEYVIIFKPSVVGGVGYCTMYVYPFVEGQIVYNSAYGHYVVSGTQNRVVGGVYKSGSSWTDKWIYQLNGSSEEITTAARPIPTVRIYSDGADILFRRIRAYQPGPVATPVDNYVCTSETASSGTIPVNIPVEYPCALFVWVKYSSSLVFPASYEYGSQTTIFVGLKRLHTDGSWVDFGRPSRIDGLTSTYNNKSVYVPVSTPGTYRLHITSGETEVPTGDLYHGGHCFARCGISRISASVLSVFGSTVGY